MTARSAAYPNRTFQGVVQSIDTRVDPVSRTVTVRSRVENEQGLLRARGKTIVVHGVRPPQRTQRTS